MKMRTRIVKIGGSLIQRADIADQVRHWMGQQSPANHLVLLGGGKLIDVVREIDQVHACDSEVIHWLCVELLSATFTIAKSWFPEWGCVESPSEFDAWQRRRNRELEEPTLININAFYHPKQTGGLPLDWRTTTDSIAAMLGHVTRAEEVVLLKSCEIPSGLTARKLVDAGIVDDAFADTIGELRFRLAKL